MFAPGDTDWTFCLVDLFSIFFFVNDPTFHQRSDGSDKTTFGHSNRNEWALNECGRILISFVFRIISCLCNHAHKMSDLTISRQYHQQIPVASYP